MFSHILQNVRTHILLNECIRLFNHLFQIFMSDATDENELSSIDGICKVLPYSRLRQGVIVDNVYYCRHKYDPIRGKLMPLSSDTFFFGQLSDKAIGSGAAETSSDIEGSDDYDSVDNTNDTDFEPTKKAAMSRKRVRPAGTTVRKQQSRSKPRDRICVAMPALKTSSAVTPNVDGKEALDLARARLHVSAVSDELPCREVEYYSILEFVRDQIQTGTGGCMFVSGVPGTGKTATIRAVARALRLELSAGGINPFHFVELNGMALTTPQQAYVELWRAISGSAAKVTAVDALQRLQRCFTTPNPRRHCTVVLADELDQLWTRKQEVMYNLFDWPNQNHSRLVVVAVANTMDLPERVLIHRVSSRIGLRRLTFQVCDI